MTENEKFFAWLDAQLEGAEAAEMERRVASDPKLAAAAEQHRAMQHRLKSTFDAVAAAPIPQRLRAAAAPKGADVIDLAERRRRFARPAFAAVPQWSAIAATLVLGLFLGTLIPGRSDAPVEMHGDGLYAASSLDRALETQLASAPAGDIRIGLTFRNESGTLCRSFTAPQATGLACRDDGRWQVRGLFPSGEGQQGDYRMAAGVNPALAELIDSTMAGEPLDASEEAAARQRGWR